MRRMARKAALFASAAIFGGVGTASAQVATAEPVAPAEEQMLPDLIVTAQKRLQSLQDVPLSVSVLDTAELERQNVTDVAQLRDLAPNLQFEQEGDAKKARLVVRGIGRSGAATYVDQVDVQPRLFRYFDDVERVEVLRGPQGTLFGKNSTTGAINIVTRRPTFDLDGSAFGVLASDADPAGSGGSVTLSDGLIGDTLAGRVNFGFRDQQGAYVRAQDDDRIGGERGYSARGRLLLVGGDRLTVLASAIRGWSRRNGNIGGYNFVNPEVRAFLTANGVEQPLDPFSYRTNLDQVPDSVQRITFGSIEVGYEFDAASLTTITAVTAMDTDQTEDLDFTAAFLRNLVSREERRLVSQEVRLAARPGATFEWLIGTYLERNVERTDLSFLLGELGSRFETITNRLPNGNLTRVGEIGRQDRNEQENEVAIFTHNIFRVAPRVELIAGVRYSWYRESADNVAVGRFGERNGIVDDRYRDSDWSGTASVNYRPVRDVLLFGTVARGYKAGGLQRGDYNATGDVASFESEIATNYEVGIKSRLFEGRLIANVTAFYISYDNFSVDQRDPIDGTVTTVGTGLTSKGFEAELQWRPVRRLQLVGGLGLVDATYDDFAGQACNRQQLLVYVAPNPNARCVQDLTGRQLQGAARWTGQLAATYTLPLGRDRDLAVRGDMQFRSSYFAEELFDERGFQDAYQIFNARLEYNMGPVTVALFGRNLGNAKFFTNAQRNGVTRRDRQTDQSFAVFLASAPASYGLTARYRF